MDGEPYSSVREAMRIIREGDLVAATAAIQRGLSGTTEAEPSPAARSPERGFIEGTCRVVDDQPLATKVAPVEGSPAPASTPKERTQFSEHTYSGSAGTRRYKLFIPSAYRGQPLPLIVMLHGCAQTPDDFATGTRMNMLAEQRACFVLYPEQPQSANMSKCWNWFQAGNQRRDQGEPAIIAGLVRELLVTYGLDRERIYVGGLSAGGAMAVILGRAYPELFAAIGVHSGLPYGAAHDLPSAFAAMHQRDTSGSPSIAHRENPQAWRRAIPTIVFHGDRDTTVHPCNGKKVVSQSTGGACNVGDGSGAAAASEETCATGILDGHSYTRTIFKDATGNAVVEYWLVHGAAHAWFGGDPRGSYTDAKGPDASSEMIRFFLERVRASSHESS
ncbi:MAG: PHB depolymerase family esterase [Betaproteobacteria bacterium]|nr:MAG: PHB depolymerase family esterase [Betaproteobacteria bacterium]